MFEHDGWALDVEDAPGSYRAGDLLASWMLQRHGSDGEPLIMHTMGQGTREENVLFEISAYYRPRTTPIQHQPFAMCGRGAGSPVQARS